MSKVNNINPGQYYDGDRNHQGEGIPHEQEKAEMGKNKAQQRQGQGSRNFIPGEAPVGESKEKK